MDPTLFVNRSKKARVNWSKDMLQKYDRGASKHVYGIVTGDESWSQSTVWVFQDEPNPTKVARARSAFKQMIAGFSEKKLDMSQSYH